MIIVSHDQGKPCRCNHQPPSTQIHPMSSDRLHITIKLFAVYQEAYGVPELQWDMPVGATVMQVGDRLIAEHPELDRWRNLTRFGVNLQFVEPHTLLEDGDEVVLIPPVSGG